MEKTPKTSETLSQHYSKHIVIEIISKLQGLQIHNGGMITILLLLRVGEMDIL